MKLTKVWLKKVMMSPDCALSKVLSELNRPG